MNSGQVTGAILLDLKKAFDVISHKKMLEKLPYYGVRIKELKWFENYLIGRKQCVSISQLLCNTKIRGAAGLYFGSVVVLSLYKRYVQFKRG